MSFVWSCSATVAMSMATVLSPQPVRAIPVAATGSTPQQWDCGIQTVAAYILQWRATGQGLKVRHTWSSCCLHHTRCNARHVCVLFVPRQKLTEHFPHGSNTLSKLYKISIYVQLNKYRYWASEFSIKIRMPERAHMFVFFTSCSQVVGSSLPPIQSVLWILSSEVKRLGHEYGIHLHLLQNLYI
jgi:hypothetical protein